MNILVTGGAGFIGSNFIHYWMKNHPQDKIVNYDKLTYAGNLDNVKDFVGQDNYKFVQADICDLGTVIKTLQYHKIDTIVHFAAHSHVDRSVLLEEFKTLDMPTRVLFEKMLPGDFILNNVWGTNVLLKAAVEVWEKSGFKNKRFHHISTDEVYGALALDDKKKFDENTIYDPRSPYSASKAASDHIVKAYHATFGLPITISNTSNNYGPYQYPEKLLPVAITNLMNDEKVPIYGDGKYVRDWLYVDDHCRGIELILEKGKAGETYCIGGLDDDENNLSLIKRILKIMGKSEDMLEFIKDRPGHDRRYAIDFSKATKELGYQPQHDLDTYLEKTINWYQDNQWWWKKILAKKSHQDYIKKQYKDRK